MINAHAIKDRKFQAGDKVFLGEGPNQGMSGVFLKLVEDVNWADITERNGGVRRHLVSWLRHGDSPAVAQRSWPKSELRLVGTLTSESRERG